MSSLINKKIQANNFENSIPKRIRLISSKHDEGNVKGGLRLAASDDKIAPFSTDNYQKLLAMHPQRAKFAAPNQQNLHSFFITDFDPYKAIMFFPNGSAADPNKKFLKFLKILLVRRMAVQDLIF